jgi:hypothetical protein
MTAQSRIAAAAMSRKIFPVNDYDGKSRVEVPSAKGAIPLDLGLNLHRSLTIGQLHQQFFEKGEVTEDNFLRY